MVLYIASPVRQLCTSMIGNVCEERRQKETAIGLPTMRVIETHFGGVLKLGLDSKTELLGLEGVILGVRGS